jgi:hypothetical protein
MDFSLCLTFNQRTRRQVVLLLEGAKQDDYTRSKW